MSSPFRDNKDGKGEEMLGTVHRPPTEPMKKFVNGLLAERDWDQAEVLSIAPSRDYSFDQAKALIEYLKSCDVKSEIAAQRKQEGEAVPAGRYAVATDEGAINKLAFYRVDRPTEGKWAGYVFVKQIIGPNEERLSRPVAQAIIAKIAAVGAEQASAAYGRAIKKCGICHRRLTNDESRKRGIGPDCAAKMGW